MPRRVLVCGPPAAGKTTYVREHAKPGDVVLDYDEIARELGSRQAWDHPKQIGLLADAEMRRRMRALPADRDAWVIRCAPGRERDVLARELGAQVVLLDVPADEAKARAARDRRPDWTAAAIDRWWSIHTTNLPRWQELDPWREPTMSEAPTEMPATEEEAPEATPKTFDAEYVEKLRRENAKWRTEAKTHADAARRLAEIEDSQKSEAQKAAERIAALEQEAASARRDALRFKVASKFGIGDEDTDLFLTGSDEDTLTKQAQRLADRADERKKQGNYVPREGTPAPAVDNDERATARALFAR